MVNLKDKVSSANKSTLKSQAPINQLFDVLSLTETWMTVQNIISQTTIYIRIWEDVNYRNLKYEEITTERPLLSFL